MTDGAKGQPLEGVRVLDLSRFIAGPICGQILGDFGAEVIKVERPGGEDSRHHDPYYKGQSLFTMLYNRNKYGITLDTRHPSATGILERLVDWADVVLENYRPGTMEKMGLGYERLKEIKPNIIMVSISGFGQTGPLSKKALFDAIAQASSGLMSITGDPDGQPTLTGTYVSDYVTGFQGAIGALAAVMHKWKTGEGQLVDVASLDASFSILGTRLIAELMLGKSMPRSGSRDLLTAPVNVYPCLDGSMYIQAGTQSLFPKLCTVMGRQDLCQRPEYSGVDSRMAHQGELEAIVAQWAADKTSEQIGAALDEAGIPNAKVATVREVMESPQIAARGMISQVDHAELGPLKFPSPPIMMEKSPPEVRKAPPMVGEDNDDVYRRVLGMSDEEIDELRRSGAI